MELGDGLGHLSYSTLVHAGDTWAEMSHSLPAHLKSGDVTEYVSRELEFVRDELVG